MILDVLAIFVFVGSIVTGVVLMWRRLPHGRAAGEVCCLSCGTPATQFYPDAFACPTCGRDARELGLAARKSGALADPFWPIVWFSAILWLVALVSALGLRAAFHEVYVVSSYRLQVGDGTAYQRATLNASGTRAGDNGPFKGELEGELVSAAGDLVTIEIHCPSLRYDLVDDAGRTLVPLSQGPFDEAAVLQWMIAAKLDPADPLVRGISRQFYQHICQTLKIPPAPATSAKRLSMSSTSSGGYSSSETAPAALMPACVMGASVAWLIGTWLILLSAAHKPRSAGVAKQVAA